MSEYRNTGRNSISNKQDKIREITGELQNDTGNIRGQEAKNRTGGERNTRKKEEHTNNSVIRRQRSYLTAGVIALMAVVAMAGVYHRNRIKQEEIEQETVIMADNEWKEDLADENLAYDYDALDDAAWADQDGIAEEEVPTESADFVEGSIPAEPAAEKAVETFVQEEPEILSFSETGEIGWPVHGDVILNYSMDKSVYFATLDQYKYNPAIIIQSDVNTKVNAAASGEIVQIDTTAETGATVTVDIGDGYQLIYGQLKDIQFEEGDFVHADELIGFVSEPTKYYSVEGSNLYFEMQKDGEPVNPLDFLK